MLNFQIWIEGWRTTGNDGQAQLYAEKEADSFSQACERVFENDTSGNFNQESLTYWGCRLFDNEQDARKRFG